ncbi:uncharacterized protein PSFLO_04404 [Pseudozyma flocculosa]|uniref:Uncharacterized protein n=1 Tax=Pseudozyma flocculosa TaxID=84751 RepID=A0A5C3F4Q9_9BASI|nr:uncharacterized protein PSFLO_04404 [Pseudozyma flocculosa]
MPYSWYSKRQGLITDSTTFAEYVAMQEATKEIMWVLQETTPEHWTASLEPYTAPCQQPGSNPASQRPEIPQPHKAYQHQIPLSGPPPRAIHCHFVTCTDLPHEQTINFVNLPSLPTNKLQSPQLHQSLYHSRIDFWQVNQDPNFRFRPLLYLHTANFPRASIKTNKGQWPRHPPTLLPTTTISTLILLPTRSSNSKHLPSIHRHQQPVIYTTNASTMTDAANTMLRKSTRARKATTLQVMPIVQTASKRKDSADHTTNKRARANSKAKEPTQEAKGSNQEPKTLLQGSGSTQASSTNTDNAN